MIRAILMASNPILRSGLREFLRQAEDITVTGELSSLEDLPRFATEVDVIVIALASVPRFDLGRFFPAEGILPAVLILSDETADLAGLIRLPARAWGVLPQDADAPEIIAAVRSLGEGLIVGSPRLLKPPSDHPG